MRLADHAVAATAAAARAPAGALHRRDRIPQRPRRLNRLAPIFDLVNQSHRLVGAHAEPVGEQRVHVRHVKAQPRVMLRIHARVPLHHVVYVRPAYLPTRLRQPPRRHSRGSGVIHRGRRRLRLHRSFGDVGHGVKLRVRRAGCVPRAAEGARRAFALTLLVQRIQRGVEALLERSSRGFGHSRVRFRRFKSVAVALALGTLVP